MKKIVIATRGSKLALIQAGLVADALHKQGVETSLKIVMTKGDRLRESSLLVIGGNGLFVREKERCLLSGEADVAVHNGEDLPGILSEGLMIGGMPEAETAADCVLIRKEPVRVLGTGSARREAECRKLYPEAEIVPAYGNIDTRLRKLRSGEFDGLVLSEAWVKRLGDPVSDLKIRRLSAAECMPAACQGILAVECQSGDRKTAELLRKITHEPSRRRYVAERAMMRTLNANFTMPVGVHADVCGEALRIKALFRDRKAEESGPFSEYPEICRKLKKKLTRGL